MLRRKPSVTSLVAFFLIVSPLVYALSYAPIVRICEAVYPVPQISIRQGACTISADRVPVADASQYPPYKPVDWVIDNTPLRTPLFYWAEVWGVRKPFEYGYFLRNPLPPFGVVEPVRRSDQR